MLDENQIVDAVCAYLEAKGYEIVQSLHTHQKGIDIVARNPTTGAGYLIEAKGGTSSRRGTERHGEEFKSSQVMVRVSKASYTTMCLLNSPERGQGDRVAMAFPDTPPFRRLVEKIRQPLNALHIDTFWISEDGQVKIEQF